MLSSKVVKDVALKNREKTLFRRLTHLLQLVEPYPTTPQPFESPAVRLLSGLAIASPRRALIERHYDVSTKSTLDVHDRFRGENVARSVNVALKVDTVVMYFAGAPQRKNLVATTVR
tara:strand:+ start:2249 stop:2599 length:351 start_codon:yes stop_codon:yes gene_type:complete